MNDHSGTYVIFVNVFNFAAWLCFIASGHRLNMNVTFLVISSQCHISVSVWFIVLTIFLFSLLVLSRNFFRCWTNVIAFAVFSYQIFLWVLTFSCDFNEQKDISTVLTYYYPLPKKTDKKKKKMFIWTQFYRDQPVINSDKPRWEETKSKRKDFDDKMYFYHNDRLSSEP